MLLLDQRLSNMISQNPILLKLDDFNARNSSWWKNDYITSDGIEIHLHVISDPTHVFQTSSSCIDLKKIPNFEIGSGVHPSFHTNCHHQIVFCKLNSKFEYSQPHERLVWD